MEGSITALASLPSRTKTVRFASHNRSASSPMESEDDPKSRDKTVRLPEEFIQWFQEAAEANGLTFVDAAREAMLAWGKRHHP